ncbi:Vi polysaccharide biosynthesis UDP-N-acetylglucosamine C-6 dehydrogenase TviB [Ovoidimarina sediminis]|uniref:Vi polysaccharide biosynthesis UDP-N-acetylglucosamine C-6 dehydrogenase TviB n=1 Tax=Ovoidimarina sediminis TaxID=3079856 RepID=UPI00291021F8|nr:Vi polysaccharide biosynthesis UDP-N-acetylglucosamine C-6 dehydrogenase TviB [Rhodophyticola sp. MJ-SS7]MDU8944945.1 Vi polysaccharide biosynthesis UDP-N-acetylglucosamine C-6 dehydrogenase TviB [Rhodophyticola sp. MJ-SS7]
MTSDTPRIGVIGLGYVGLPLAVAFGRVFDTVGFDVKTARVTEIRAGADSTHEVPEDDLRTATHLTVSTDPADLAACTVFIVTVPTPIDAAKRPDLAPLRAASETVGAVLKPGDTVVYESTVFPGATEEVCIPILERASGLRFNTDFTAGYSPERINPGDKARRLPNIVKVTSGSTPEAAERIDALYRAIIPAGTYRAESIRVAEAAKVIENTQRDLNIALMNELAIVFDRLGLDTETVLRAAGSKWNFLPFRPGLVGGHCIGVDPYYLTYRAEQSGYHPQIILAGRRLNDGMGAYVAGKLVKELIRRDIPVRGARVLLLGLTFKEDCPDLRNTRVIDVIAELKEYGAEVDVHDPWVSAEEARAEYGIALTADPSPGSYDAVIVAVAHCAFREAGAGGLRAYGRDPHVLFDVKSVFAPEDSDLRL